VVENLADRPAVSREAVISALTRSLEPLEYVHAFWEGGAIGYGRLDEWSDIDAYVVVDDDRVDDAFRAIEDALTSLSPIKTKLDVGKTPWPGIYQAFYRLADASEFLLLDMAVLTKSAPDKFLEPETHGKAIFYFDKSGGLEPTSLDRAELKDKVRGRVARLQQRVEVFHVFVKKELNRGQLMEAIDAYRVVLLDSLTEVLRIRYCPVHYEFRTRYLYHELPADVSRRLEELYLIRDRADLEAKYSEAKAWFYEVHREIESIGVDALVDD
jgi:hypothetical protein